MSLSNQDPFTIAKCTNTGLFRFRRPVYIAKVRENSNIPVIFAVGLQKNQPQGSKSSTGTRQRKGNRIFDLVFTISRP